VIGDVRRTDGTEQDGVELAELVGAVGRHHHAMCPVIVRTPAEVLEVQGEPAIALGADLQDLDAGLDHLGPDAITAHGGNFVRTHVAVPARLRVIDPRSRHLSTLTLFPQVNRWCVFGKCPLGKRPEESRMEKHSHALVLPQMEGLAYYVDGMTGFGEPWDSQTPRWS